ncbi:acyclic terpene utilization AtuA family protein [Enemella evansiae]|uniref:acyclic terpene utilization AtuA family protein n=1 Tax=Enemella evansiae TaxID=2016499 RepID=UPI001E62A748|nr:acyclic terpene utilization AtuA family protein [Enemella evansiae]
MGELTADPGPRTIRLGAGAGFAGDRIDPAVQIARDGELDYLIFECLGERTVALGQARRLADPSSGHDPMLAERMRAVLPHCVGRTRIITNSGAANPRAAGELVRRVADELGLGEVRVAVIEGDDVLAAVRRLDPPTWEDGRRLGEIDEPVISANAYLGCAPIVEALATGADVVITGRCSDPALYLAPLVHEFGWSTEDWQRLGRGTLVGHLLECAGQLTGGYFADPVTKPVPGLARLGFPFADVDSDGNAIFGKPAGSGGRLDAQTCAEQLLYEVDDPANYLTPDVVADFSAVRFTELGPDRVRAEGASGKPRPPTLKVTVGFRSGWQGEGQLSYAGPRALERARLAAEVTIERLQELHGFAAEELFVELIGAGAALRLRPEMASYRGAEDPIEVRLRVVGRAATPERARLVGQEVEGLYTNGPAGGGGSRQSHHEVIAIRSVSLPSNEIRASVQLDRPHLAEPQGAYR